MTTKWKLMYTIISKSSIEGMLMGDHIAALLNLWQQIMATGKIIPNIWVAHAHALLLPKGPAWDVVKVQLLWTKPLTLEMVSATLQAEANRRMCDKVGGGTALFTSERSNQG